MFVQIQMWLWDLLCEVGNSSQPHFSRSNGTLHIRLRWVTITAWFSFSFSARGLAVQHRLMLWFFPTIGQSYELSFVWYPKSITAYRANMLVHIIQQLEEVGCYFLVLVATTVSAGCFYLDGFPCHFHVVYLRRMHLSVISSSKLKPRIASHNGNLDMIPL